MTKALQITFDEVSATRLLQRLQVSTLVDPVLDELYDGFCGRVLRTAQANAPRDTGDLAGSGKILKDGPGFKKGRAVVFTAAHAKFVHDGTRPHWPPVQALEGWAGRHGIPAFLVARSIARKGTKAQPFLKEAFDSEKKSLPADLRTAARSIEKRYQSIG